MNDSENVVPPAESMKMKRHPLLCHIVDRERLLEPYTDLHMKSVEGLKTIIYPNTETKEASFFNRYTQIATIMVKNNAHSKIISYINAFCMKLKGS